MLGVAVVLCLAVSWCHGLTTIECAQQCDLSEQLEGDAPFSDIPLVFCGTDNHTYNTTKYHFTNNDCYSHCGIAALYGGPCGCPNNCGGLAHGSCFNATCECLGGWGGVDCMTVECPNDCGGNGACGASGFADGSGQCVCDEGFTGAYCDVPVFDAPQIGSAIPNSPPLFAFDPARGASTFFNPSVLASIRVVLPDEQYRFLIDPFNVYNATYTDGAALMSFDNGIIRRTNVTIGMKVKGYSSRIDLKKGWNIKLTAKGDSLGGTSSFGIKTGNDGSDSFTKTFMADTLSRAIGAPTGRAGWCTLFINGVFMGIYFYDEDVDKSPYLSALFGNSGGSLFKMQNYFQLNYFGDNASDPSYQQGKTQFITFLRNVDGSNWTDFIGFLRTVNQSYWLPGYDPTSIVNVDSFLRSLALEAFLMATDNFMYGNNYYMYHDTATGLWNLIDHDWDCVYEYWDSDVCSNVYDFAYYYADSHPAEYFSAVRASVLNVPRHNETFGVYLGYFVDRVFNVRGNNVSLSFDEVYLRAAAFILPWFSRDTFGQMAFATSPELFMALAQNTSASLLRRAKTVAGQVPLPAHGQAGPSSSLTNGEVGAIAAGCVVALVGFVLLVIRLRRPRQLGLLDEAGETMR